MSAVPNDRLATSPDPLIPFERREHGWGIWETYRKAVTLERNELGDYSATTMTGVLTFTGLFAATVAAFLIESYKTLSPDSGAQSVALLSQLVTAANGNGTRIDSDPMPFEASDTSVMINILWFIALVVSLASALLATLVQEWTRDLIRAQARLADVQSEKKCVEHLGYYMGAEAYGLHRLPSLVVGLMHAAVILFLIGLDIFLFTIHRRLALVVSAVTGAIAFVYIVASSIPLFRVACPYRTPMTDFLFVFIGIPALGLSSLLLYVMYAIAVGIHRVTDGPLEPWTTWSLHPIHFFDVMTAPLTALRAWRGTKSYFTLRKTDKSIRLFTHVSNAIRSGNGNAEQHPLVSPEQMVFVWDRVWEYALAHAPALHYFGGVLAYAREPVIDSLFTGWRNDPEFVAKVAESLDYVNSPYSATAALRLLQLLFQAEAPEDRVMQQRSKGAHRWECTACIFKVFPQFAAKLELLMAQAKEDQDSSLPAALASFRLTLLRLLNTVPSYTEEAGLPDGRDSIRLVFRELQRYEHTKLLPLAVHDTDQVEDLFVRQDWHLLLELSSRNALTLIDAANKCHWHGSWSNPDGQFLPVNAAGVFDWRKMNAGTVERRQKPSASGPFRDLLAGVGLQGWLEPNSQFLDPESGDLDPSFGLAVRALRDLACAVEICPTSADAHAQPMCLEQGRLEHGPLEPAPDEQTPSPTPIQPSPRHRRQFPASHNAGMSRTYHTVATPLGNV
ncbi:unnamed protein product [Peniophora sp. CBMAI 1063]|nr:unnamed protein product [Peniophora sp. CBMAI 1063]